MALGLRKVALVGHPNAGKSAIFSHLTARYAAVSNYPGTTVDIFRGRTTVKGQPYEILDTPGINGLEARSEDERVTLDILQKDRPDLIVQVADGKNLRRTLYLTARLAELKIPLLLDLNMKDESQRKGISVDVETLSRCIGVPVVETVGTTGQGLQQIRDALDTHALCMRNGETPIQWVESILHQVGYQEAAQERWTTLETTLWTVAILVGAFFHLENYFGAALGWPTLYGWIISSFSSTSQSAQPGLLATAAALVGGYLFPVLLPFLWAVRADTSFNEKFGVWARKFATGSVILVIALSLLYQLVGNLGAQVFVGLLETQLFATYFIPWLQLLLPAGFFYDLLVGQYGVISVGLTYGIAIVLPVVFTFFIAFSFLEDSGYLPRLAILSDKLFRSMGLNGKALLPMVLGLGCVTMATMTTRILNTKKERLIATVLLALGVPCSAQLGVIMGIVAGASPQATVVVFGTVFTQLLVVGYVLSRILPGHRSDFVLEIPPIRCPLWSNILKKTSLRVRWFLKEALPLFVLGTLILFLLDRIALLDRMIELVEPVVTGILQLPRETATVFLLGFLRRDYGAAGLFDMARSGTLSSLQTVVSLTVMTLFVPCIANFFVLIKEQGLKISLVITFFITAYSVSVGALLNLLLRFLEVTV
ncbi:MAG: ferrous iron transport protein B [Acidobacteria bacterium]|nr:ferrous iron transport protein B [Acidobacteriota bacterium]